LKPNNVNPQVTKVEWFSVTVVLMMCTCCLKMSVHVENRMSICDFVHQGYKGILWWSCWMINGGWSTL